MYLSPFKGPKDEPHDLDRVLEVLQVQRRWTLSNDYPSVRSSLSSGRPLRVKALFGAPAPSMQEESAMTESGLHNRLARVFKK